MVEVFPVLGETTTSTEPADGAFDDPALGQNHEALGLIAAADDFGYQARQGVRQTIMEHRPGVSAVGKQLLEKRGTARTTWTRPRGRHRDPNTGGGDQRMQQQSQSIDEDVALLALDQLAAIKPVRINAVPPLFPRSSHFGCR